MNSAIGKAITASITVTATAVSSVRNVIVR